MANKKNTPKGQKLPRGTQTIEARITAASRVIADHPANAITPAKLKALFDDAEAGNITAQHELFADIEERDSAIAAALGTRKRAVLTLDYRIAAPRNATPAEDALTKAVDELIAGIDGFEDLLMDMMDAVGHGFAPIELIWSLQDGVQLPVVFCHRPQTLFCWDKDDGLLLKTPDNQQGEALWPLGWVVHIQLSAAQAAQKIPTDATIVTKPLSAAQTA